MRSGQTEGGYPKPTGREGELEVRVKRKGRGRLVEMRKRKDEGERILGDKNLILEI